MQTLLEQTASRTIGIVESVSPIEIKVLLDIEAPQSTALNSGIPMPFPRINGFVLIPNERGSIVGLVTWIGVERSAYPKRTGMKDFGLVDLPFPLRKMSLSPLGTLAPTCDDKGQAQYCLERGVYVFPSVGDAVLIPAPDQLRSIIEASQEEDRRVPIGTSPLAGDATVSIDPDKLFGRHLAILGNTGSGKSCSVAGLIRWTLEEASKKSGPCEAGASPKGARFIVLDPNGEYGNTLSSLSKFGYNVKVFGFSSSTAKDDLLPLPAWLWNAEEWSAFTRAAPGVQYPVLLSALRSIKSKATADVNTGYCKDILFCKRTLEQIIGNSKHTSGDKNTKLEIYYTLCSVLETAKRLALQETESMANKAINEAMPNIPYGINGMFSRDNISKVIESIHNNTPQGAELLHTECEDRPVHFDTNELSNRILSIASGIDSRVQQQVGTLVMRIDGLLRDDRLGHIIAPNSGPTSFKEWLDLLFGCPGKDQYDVIVLNLQFLPYDILHMAIAVLSRLIFLVAQYHRKIASVELPTVLVLEEAHTFVKKGSDAAEDVPSPAAMCRRTFERIAREGRKFGLGLVLASQRPSELSPTVLSQCNTFLLHRIVNDKDQELVGKMVPDNLSGLLRDLPSLPSRQAILLGWATPVPVLVEMRKLEKEHRPAAPDPSFWKTWTEAQKSIDHEKIAAEITNTGYCTDNNDSDLLD